MIAVEPVLLLVVGVVVMGGLAWFGWAQAKKRRELFLQFASSNGWSYVPRDDSWASRFDGACFGNGDSREARNVLQGQWQGRPMVAFDYSYETHSTDSQGRRSTTTHRYAVCALGLDAWLPRVELHPESVFGRLGTALGMQDVELESEDFNRRYRVKADDAKLAYDVLPARTMEALLARPALHLRLQGTDALCWEDGSHSPSELLARLDALRVWIDGIPSFVWSDLKGRS